MFFYGASFLIKAAILYPVIISPFLLEVKTDRIDAITFSPFLFWPIGKYVTEMCAAFLAQYLRTKHAMAFIFAE